MNTYRKQTNKQAKQISYFIPNYMTDLRRQCHSQSPLREPTVQEKNNNTTILTSSLHTFVIQSVPRDDLIENENVKRLKCMILKLL
jgi:hypothetical protein